ncbi:iron-containing alcohol dehydrogenase family protein [Devosia sp. Root635]|uniref:iron-containing alcohol dehydrogenase family protein n=1 Tax=Devosia sp. Root635 TaxID=1736575 RepID=UPI0006FC2D31|nr:iron-containing alcohol dehydrogenase [Devosia sp. Root635]KRA55926.1 alcohol dehydrogenase [Devosia sp. Root635]
MTARLDDKIDLRRPPLVRFGAGQLAGFADWVAERGFKRPFVVSDSFNAARLVELGLGSVSVFGELRAEPDLAALAAARAAMQAVGPDLVIGFGGGSAMDLAKILAVLAGTDQPFDSISGLNRAPARRVGLAQIPTTAGTGSEVGTRALITDPATLNKISTESPHMLADIAIIDPVLTASVPPAVTAATGVDALAHCVEAYTSRRAHPVVDAYAIEGIRLIGRYLKRAVADGGDLEARAGLSLAAFYGGVCLGPVNTTAGHAISYPLGTVFGIPHGVANALVFPHTLAINAAAVPEKTAAICAALGLRSTFGAELLQEATGFCAALGLAMRLSDHGVTQDALPGMAEQAHAIRRLLDFNPLALSAGDIEAIYRAAY